MKFKLLWIQFLGITFLPVICTSIFFVGCGTSEEDNYQPQIEVFISRTLDVGETKTADVRITDANDDDTHIINVSSGNPTVASVSISDEESFTVTGHSPGVTTIIVSATDNSGQENDTSLPMTFEITVKEPFRLAIKGLCTVGMTLQSGEGCIYVAPEVPEPIVFYVNEDNQGCRTGEHVFDASGLKIHTKGISICVIGDRMERAYFFNENRLDPYDLTNFGASRNSDGSWTIRRVPE